VKSVKKKIIVSSAEKQKSAKVSIWIQEGIVLLVCFLYLIFRVHPVLILEWQPPVFFKGFDFLVDSLKIPGGMADWLSAFIMQFWFSDLLSSLFLIFCFWMVAFLTRKWMETLTEIRPIHTFHLIPAGILLVLHNQYDYNFSMTVALIINLTFLFLFIRWAPKQQVIRSVLGLTVSIFLYWITGGAFLTFTILCGLEDLFFRKRFASGFLFLLISAVLPLGASEYVFLVTLTHSYFHNLSFENPLELSITGYALQAFFLLVILIMPLVKFYRIRKSFQKISKYAYVWKWTAGTIILLGGTILLAEESTNEIKRLVFKNNRAVSENRWTDVLESARHCSNITPVVSCQTNLALFETGRLLDSMFTYPQTNGSIELFMNDTWCYVLPEETSNLYWKLGSVNRSLHWAHEALECKGPTPDILKRLGMAYMVKRENEAAKPFFLKLRNVPFQRKTADELIRLNENPAELAQDSICTYIRSCMLNEDIISNEKPSILELELLSKRNPKNKMAFEYLIASFLLNGNSNEIWKRYSDLDTITSSEIPRHVQEAMMMNAVLTPKFDLSLLKKMVVPLIYNRFVDYQQILYKYKNSKYQGAKQELKIRFGDTYWYYLMFTKPTLQQSDRYNEYQQ
jgi:hypothetical protein